MTDNNNNVVIVDIVDVDDNLIELEKRMFVDGGGGEGGEIGEGGDGKDGETGKGIKGNYFKDIHCSGINKIAEQKDISSFIPDVDEGYLPMECRKKIIPYRFYKDICETMYNKFGYNDGKLSSALNVISLYLKGQKLLYLEAKAYCEHYLYRMMLPAIVISSASSVISGVYSDNSTASKTVAGATALNTLILSLINYFKLDAKAEAHKMTAYSFEQLISECEFTSGKILLSNINENDRNKRIRKRGEKREKDEKEEGNGGRGEEDNKGNTGGIKYDIYYIQDFINNIEKKVKEIKEKNQFIIPEKIRNRYPNICNKNIFMEVKNMNINEMVLCNQLKVIGIEETDYNNRIILGDRTPEVYEHRRNIYRIKNEKIEQIMAYRKQKTQYDKDITCELENNKYKHSGWIFY
jgi:hypothetical protein